MKKLSVYLLFSALFFGCSGSGPKSNDTVAVDTNRVDTTRTATDDTVTDKRFTHFWEQFKLAVKHKDTAAINKLTCFPIRNLHPCYLPTTGKTISTDTAGLSAAEFGKLNKKVFDDETSWLTKTPADSVFLYEKKNDDKNLPLQNITDKNTPIYQYAVVYAQNKKGGDKNLYFGSVKSAYKLIWIDCDGDVTGHTH